MHRQFRFPVQSLSLIHILKSRGISRLDGIYVSHTDEDHISGVRELLEFVEKDLTSLRIEDVYKRQALESRAGWKGLCRKGMTLLYVLIAARLDASMGTEYLRDKDSCCTT